MYWFIADLHLDHTNVLKLSKRPFSSIQEMEKTILANIKKVVKPSDVIILVGDVVLGRKKSWVKFLNSLPTKNVILVKGNHDTWKNIPKDMITLIVGQLTIIMFGRLFVVCHYPYRCSWWRAFIKRLHPAVLSKKRPVDRGLWLLHGHDHRTTNFVDYHPRMFSVGVDANNFKPISDSEIIRRIQKQESMMKGRL